MPFKVDVCARGRLARGGVRRQMRTVKVLKKPPELTFTDTHTCIYVCLWADCPIHMYVCACACVCPSMHSPMHTSTNTHTFL